MSHPFALFAKGWGTRHLWRAQQKQILRLCASGASLRMTSGEEREKVTEKLVYMHENPVKRGLVLSAEEWNWSSGRFYGSGEQGVVKILEDRIAAYRELS
jgi:hypothetical protein